MIATWMIMWMYLNNGGIGHGACIYDSHKEATSFIKTIKFYDPNSRYIHYFTEKCPKDLDIPLNRKLKIRFDAKDIMHPIKIVVPVN